MSAIALFDFTAREDDELSVRRGERLIVVEGSAAEDTGWVLQRSSPGALRGRTSLMSLS